MMINEYTKNNCSEILYVVNDAATRYKDSIPDDCWKDPYMPSRELRNEISAGVQFFGEEHKGNLIGIMGKQFKGDVILLRHAYVQTV